MRSSSRKETLAPNKSVRKETRSECQFSEWIVGSQNRKTEPEIVDMCRKKQKKFPVPPPPLEARCFRNLRSGIKAP